MPAGHVATLADMQNLTAAVTFLLNRPMTRVRDATGGVSILTTATTVTFTTADFDTDGMWNSGNPDRLTIQTPGWYRVRYAVTCGTAMTYSSQVVSVTGANNPRGSGITSSPRWSGYGNTNGGISCRPRGCGIWPAYLYAGDFLKVQIFGSTTGGTTGTGAPGVATLGGSYFSLEYVSI